MYSTKNIKHGVMFWLGVGLLLMQSLVYAEPEITERIEWNLSLIHI